MGLMSPSDVVSWPGAAERLREGVGLAPCAGVGSAPGDVKGIDMVAMVRRNQLVAMGTKGHSCGVLPDAPAPHASCMPCCLCGTELTP